ncbi:MAG TPA: AI-2E family transporter [bacterium]|nr:AI-2E family transporter [bacterium]HQG44124.1 AI-2E family transporter [bacterium]HQI49654.1 AI-2E family transporter [bacterium]HQJ64343.1 AI-2E family transporter [bacterium]HQJ65455.1 AI-2E family transporter [bacterium]
MISFRDPSTRKMLLLLFVLVLIIILLAMGGVAQMMIIAILLAYILDPLVVRMEAHGISRTAAAGIILLTITLLLIISLLTFVPALKAQLIAMGSGESSAKTDLALAKLQEVVRAKMGWLGYGDIDLKVKLAEFKASFGKKIIDFLVKDVVEIVLALVTIPFLMFFFIKDARSWKKGLIRMVPNRYFEFSLDLIHKMDQQLGNYLRGQFIDAVSIGTLATIGLGALSVPYFFLLGPFSGLANLIPYVGPFAGGIPSIIIAIMENGDLSAGGHVALLFLGLKLADDLCIQPLSVSSSVHLHPALVLVTCIIGGNLFGLIGMLLSVPVTGFVKVVVTESLQTLKAYRFS